MKGAFAILLALFATAASAQVVCTEPTDADARNQALAWAYKIGDSQGWPAAYQARRSGGIPPFPIRVGVFGMDVRSAQRTALASDGTILSIDLAGKMYRDGVRFGSFATSAITVVGKELYACGLTDGMLWRFSGGTSWARVTAEVDSEMLVPCAPPPSVAAAAPTAKRSNETQRAGPH